MKAIVGWFLALVLLVLVAPVILIAAIAVRLSSPGPVFYFQTRVGRRGRPFMLIKLRTMVRDAEAGTGPVWSSGEGDPRVTSVGRFLRASHIDEFPQLINVLCGRMSLVGPRPERPEIVAELQRKLPLYANRHDVRPGIAGLAQLNLPPDSNLESVRRKLVHDLYYVHKMDPLLDLRILFFTGGLLVWHVGRAVWHLVAPPGESVVDHRMRVVCGPESRLLEAVPEVHPPRDPLPQQWDTEHDLAETVHDMPKVLQSARPK